MLAVVVDPMAWRIVGGAVALVALAGCGSSGSDPDAGMADTGPAVVDGGDGGADDGGADAGPPPPARSAEAPLVQWVNPFIGTGGLGFGTGACYPGPQRPFGMVRPGPDTAPEEGSAPFAHFSGYYYPDENIHGFSHLRAHGIGISDYGVLAMMPTDGMTAERTTQQGRRSRFSHDSEQASPGYYAVTLEDTGIEVELTATDRVALHRYTFPETVDPVVLFDVAHTANDVTIDEGSIEVDPDAREMWGRVHFEGGYSRRHGGIDAFFAARFDRPFAEHGVWLGDTLAEGESAREGERVGGWAGFDLGDDRTVHAAVGVSFVDVAGARANLDAEMTDIDFDATRSDAEAEWERALSVVEIEGRTETDFRLFYTALYHTLMMPTLLQDTDGRYRGVDGEVHTASDGLVYYSDFSLWDTFRTHHPMLTLLYPEQQTEFLRALVQMAEDGGYMPRWPLGDGYTGGMVGESATIVFADSVVKGLRDYDLATAYAAMRSTAMESPPADAPYGGRSGIEEYVDLGWVPMEASGGSASLTLEYAYDDWALATLAEALGQSEDASMFAERAGNWENLYDESTGFLVGRRQDGSFPDDLDPIVWEDYFVEGNAWQYMWYAPHDLERMAEVRGGREAMLEVLREFFDLSSRRPINTTVPANYYWHGNEPDLHVAWIFSALDDPAGTARWTRWAMEEHYADDPGGLPGNDDSGTLSAWYVFAALGFYPIAGADYYLVGSPTLTRATLHLEGGDFVVEAPDASDRSIYVTGAMLNGEPLERARFTHDDIAGGGRLELDMGAEPTGWSTP
ncbi:MAG: GH92 family glycosyl hydrolase [Polyangiales bacterium]